MEGRWAEGVGTNNQFSTYCPQSFLFSSHHPGPFQVQIWGLRGLSLPLW